MELRVRRIEMARVVPMAMIATPYLIAKEFHLVGGSNLNVIFSAVRGVVIYRSTSLVALSILAPQPLSHAIGE